MRALVLLFLFTGCRDTEIDPKDTSDSGTNPQDLDGDGYTDDCDDNNPNVFPGNAEVCDGLDNDCNGQIDDDPLDISTWYADSDGDGFGDPDAVTEACEAPANHTTNSEDCDDTNVRYNPIAVEYDCEDPNDYNCDGSVGYEDADGDGHAACTECDDSNPDVHPDASEICNEIDDDCDNEIDADDSNLSDGSIFYGDSDGDGHGGQQYEAIACEAPAGFVDNTDDCNDLDPLTYPSAAEICDEEDNDCDGSVDEGVGLTWYADVDGDGYGDATTTVFACDAPQGYSSNGNDCDDTSPSARPGGVEVCNGVDDDCDGTIDGPSSLNASVFYADSDSDGYGDASTAVTDCEAPTNHVDNGTDCDDTAAATNPAADETCDGADNDCDGTVDEASAVDATTWYADADSDTYGSSAISQVACNAPSGHVADSSDCDDTNSTTNPGAIETCNNTDDNCDGSVDEGVLTTWYADLDSDGYGSPSISQDACSAPAAYVSNNLDCDDVDTGINPGATEICDASDTDEDCDGAADDNDPEGATGGTLYYLDLDGDGYGDLSDTGTSYCDDAGALVTDNTDCDDSSTGAGINPGATDTWYDGTDSDCNGASDYDADSDGFDSVDHSGTDCNDSDANILPDSNGDCYLFSFSSHTFTTCGTSGSAGPSLGSCQADYQTTGDWDEDTNFLNMTTNGIQRWTVPISGTYQISATGAAGQTNSNSYTGGTGATMQGEFSLTVGETILILVGQMGTSNTTHGNENGGGGGSFVVRDTGTEPLVIAGGGGGAPSHSYSSGCTRTNGDAQTSTSGKTVNCRGTGLGGNSGNGGTTNGDYEGGAGAGLNTDGANGSGHCSTSHGGDAFVNGGVGGQTGSCYGAASGGFGGGGAGDLASPGGGGGYSGGGAAGNWSSSADYGGGGGSFNGGSNQVNTPGTNTGHGSIGITLLGLD